MKSRFFTKKKKYIFSQKYFHKNISHALLSKPNICEGKVWHVMHVKLKKTHSFSKHLQKYKTG